MDYLTAINNHSDEVNAVSSHGNYLASGDIGGTVYVFDISDKNSPTQIATLEDHGSNAINDIVLNKDVLATAGDDNTVSLYDMSDPTTPNLVNTFTDHTASVTSLAIFEEMLFTGAEDNDIRVYDISDPSTPSSLNTSTQSSSVTSIAVDSVEYNNSDEVLDALAVGLTDGAVEVYDISTPTDFTSKSSFTDHTDIVESVDIEGNVLVTGSADNTVNVYNLITPNGYTILDTIEDSTDTIFAVKMYNNLLVTGSRDNYFRIYNVSNVQMIDKLDESSEHGNWVLDIEINKDLLITSSRDNSVRLNNISLYGAVLGLTPPLKPVFVDQGYPNFEIDRDRLLYKNIAGEYYVDAYIKNDILFMPHVFSIKLYDISDPSNPILLSDIGRNDVSYYRSCHVKDNEDILITSHKSNNVVIYDISDLSNPVEISNITDADVEEVIDVDTQDNILVSGSKSDKAKLYDISDPSNPVLLSTITDHTSNVRSVFIKDNILATGSDDNTAKLYDISDPANPVLLSTITDHTDGVYSVFIKDNILATGSYDNTAKLFDISDPANPVLLTTITDHTGIVRTVFIKDNILATGSGDNTVKLYDISDPENSVLLSNISEHKDYIWGIFIKDNIIAIAGHDASYSIHNIYDIVNSNDIDNMEVKLNDVTIQEETTGFPKVTNVDFEIPELEYMQNGRNFLDVTITDKAGISETASLGIIAEVFDRPQPGNILRFGNTMRFENQEYEITDVDYDTENYYLTLNKELGEDLPSDSKLELMNMNFTPMIYLTNTADDEPTIDDYVEMDYRSTGYRRDSNGKELAAIEEYQLENVNGEYAYFKIKGERTAPLAGTDFEGGDRFGGLIFESHINNAATGSGRMGLSGDTLAIHNEDSITGDRSIELYDISDPSSPQLLHDFIDDTSGDTINMILDIYNINTTDVLAYEYSESIDTVETHGFKLWDISDITNPILLSEVNGTGNILDDSFHNNILVLATRDPDTAKLYDISDPANPILLSTITDHNGPVTTSSIKDNILASGSRDDTVKLYDISDPSNPVLLSTITDHTGYVFSVFIKDNILATGSSDNTAKLFDISDPSNPTLLSTITGFGHYVSSVEINDDIMFLGEWGSDMKYIYDISDPSNTILLHEGTITQGGYIYDIKSKEDLVIFTTHENNMVIYSGARSEIVVNNPWVQRPRAMFAFASEG